MGLFGLSSKKEVEEREREAREQVLRSQRSSLSNLAKGSQVKITVPFFDVFDPRFSDFGVPIAVDAMLVYAIDDIDKFNQINKAEFQNDATFESKLKGQLTKYLKGVVTNAPADHQIQVIQLERKILEVSALVQQMVTPQIERLFGINVRSLDITSIRVDHESRGYRELKAVTTDLEMNKWQTVSSLNLDAMKRQQEMTLGGQEEMQRIQLENQRETMRIAREENQRATRLQTETNFLAAHQANLYAGAAMSSGGGMFGQRPIPQMPTMPGMPPINTVPTTQYMVGINGQPQGPFGWEQLKQLVEQGQLTLESQVWTQGMPNWVQACQIQELQSIFSK